MGVTELVAPATDLERFARFCERTLVLDNGRPMVLEPFQLWMMEPYFAGRIESVLSTPKGCGKSTLLGALTLFELLRTPAADIVVAAAARDQAQVLLGQAQGFVRRNPALARRLRMTRREIQHSAWGGRARVISSDASTGDGLIPSHVFVDELHRWKDDDLFTTLRVALSKRSGRMLTISTAGIREESPLWPVRERALAFGAERDGVRLSADGPGFALRELSAPADADWRDMNVAGSVNPLVTREQLELRFDGSETPWRRFTLNQWVDRSELATVIDTTTWMGLVDMQAPALPPVCLAVDATMDRDCAAIGVAAFVDDRSEVALVDVAEAGSGIAWVIDKVVLLAERYETVGVTIDPGGPAASLIPRIQEYGVPVIEVTTREVAQACTGFFDAVVAGDRLRHRGSPVLDASVQGAVKRPLSQSWAFDRRKHVGDPSPLLAATLAHFGLLKRGPMSQTAFETQFGRD